MKKHAELNANSAQAQHATPNATSPRKSHPDWKPHPCGLSREELRKIVEEILG